jgi:catechol 2,3-dioxygenase-like lactoylglutathione lyase family enzyme
MSAAAEDIVLPVVDNIVFACPGSASDLVSFYAGLLGMRVIRDDWPMIAKDQNSEPRLAFGDGPNENYRAPRWPDPEYPQQLHLDIPVSDLDAAEELALRLGAIRLQNKGDYRSYADPVGHPFCLYSDAAADGVTSSPVSGRIGRVVIDCFSPRSLAGFYAEMLDMPVREMDTPNRVVITRNDGRLPALAFQHAQVAAPRWPDPAYPQQVHLDIWVERSETAQELALRLGAIRLPDQGGSCPVFADPAGHPFCICTSDQ